MTRGWFQVPGIRDVGDRTIAEQLIGLEGALAQCRGNTVLDLGCAEGCIAAEFAKAGAASVVGIEALSTHIEVAEKIRAALPPDVARVITFQVADLRDVILQARADGAVRRYDIVLALGIIHKLRDPEQALRFAADSADHLLCLRGPGRAELNRSGGVIKAKHGSGMVNVPDTMKERGFVLRAVIDGVRGEGVQYWERW